MPAVDDAKSALLYSAILLVPVLYILMEPVLPPNVSAEDDPPTGNAAAVVIAVPEITNGLLAPINSRPAPELVASKLATSTDEQL